MVDEQPKQDEPSNEALADDDDPITLKAVYEIPVQVTAVLGRTSMPISQFLKLGRGAVVELERRIGEPVDIFVNDRLVAKGEVVIVEDKIGITMTEILKNEKPN